MNTPIMDNFADSVPNDNTYMSQICGKIFTFNNSTMTTPELSALVDETCHDWFNQALQHCTDMLFSPTETTLRAWLFHKMLNLRFYIFPTKPDTSLLSTYPHVKLNPNMLKKEDCNQLFVEVAKDYVDIAPKYSTCVEESFFLFSVFKGLIGLFVIIMIVLYTRKLSMKFRQKMMFRSNAIQTVLKDEQKRDLERQRLIANYSLRTQHMDRRHLRVVPDLYDAPTIAISVKKKLLSEAICCLIKSEPAIEKVRNGILVTPFKKERQYAMHKINRFLSRTSKCRVIIDIDLDLSDSDDETYAVQQSFSGGDFKTTIYENAAEETSSACSGLYSPKERITIKNKQERYYSSRSRQDSGSRIPTTLISRKQSSNLSCLNRRDSANSVAIVNSKDSSMSLRKSLEQSTAGKGRGVKISRI